MEPDATPKPEVTSLPPLDIEKVTQDAKEWIDRALAGVATAEGRAAAASDLERDEAKQAARWKKKREAAVHTLTVAYRLRRGAGLAEALGVPRSSLMVIRKRAAAAGHDLIPEADKVLPSVARHAATHIAREEYARRLRDAAVLELVEAEWTNAKIGELIGRDQSRVSHIKHRDDEVPKAS